jgi:isopenicillin N synthase-like dioxygenase
MFVAQIISNGIFRSPVHRVVTNAEKERLSLAVFYAVDKETMLEPAPGLLDEKRPSRYRKLKANDFVLGLFEHFSRGTRFIETLKI